MFLKLVSMLVFFRSAREGPSFSYTRQRVIYQLMKLKPCLVPEVQQLLDIMQEASLAYTMNKAELETAIQAREELKVEMKSYIKEHMAAVKKIIQLQKYFSTRYDRSETLWETINKIPDEESLIMSRREENLLKYKHTVLQEQMLKSNIYSLRLASYVDDSIFSPTIDIAEVCARTYAATSKIYSYDLNSNYRFLPKVKRTRVESSELVKLTDKAKKNPRPRRVVLPKKVYVTYWGQVVDPKEAGKFTYDRPINQKIISTDAGKGFGWTKRTNFSSKECAIYYLKGVPNSDLL
ncbi:hypothetical protein ACJMK2_023421 [Sinanodonta woodiana]|uniref:Uncharacterized protein n=1 Tax=Sinanodonta woodiana TaxID=1069815 RepID=A0ABD3T514_SINWO